jgi:heme/copper-type cytochrome/quinol oxidase subunit 2
MILGMAPNVFYSLMGFIAIGVTVCLIVFIAYRRHRTRVEYNENP